MKSSIIVTFIVLFQGAVSAQTIAPYQWLDTEALELSEDVLDKLIGKDWDHEIMVTSMRGTTDTLTRTTLDIIYYKDSTVKQHLYSGTWKVVKNKLIVNEITWNRKNSLEMLLNGAFSIYEITDSTLVLVRKMTSSGDYINKYLFSNRKFYTKQQMEAYIQRMESVKIENVNLSNQKFWPQKAQDSITLYKLCEYEIWDAYGNSMLKGKSTQIDVSKLKRGTYYIKIDGEQDKFLKK